MKNEYEFSDADRAAMAAANAAQIAHERDEEAKRQEVLREVQRIVSAEVYAEIMAELAEDGYTFDYKIASAPLGREQDDGAAWGKHYVNQTTNGGYTGDEYAGTVSIPMRDGRFFQFGYSM
jgi:hypothetical protein